MKKALVCAMILVLTACGLVCAQSVPPLVNYQGLLTDANGQGLQGTTNLEFNIYDAAVGGSNVWGPQIFSSVPVINGQFNVILGTTDTGGRSIADALSESQRFLGIKVDDGPEIAPRQQILSTPYALQAEKHSAFSSSSRQHGTCLWEPLSRLPARTHQTGGGSVTAAKFPARIMLPSSTPLVPLGESATAVPPSTYPI